MFNYLLNISFCISDYKIFCASSNEAETPCAVVNIDGTGGIGYLWYNVVLWSLWQYVILFLENYLCMKVRDFIFLSLSFLLRKYHSLFVTLNSLKLKAWSNHLRSFIISPLWFCSSIQYLQIFKSKCICNHNTHRVGWRGLYLMN